MLTKELDHALFRNFDEQVGVLRDRISQKDNSVFSIDTDCDDTGQMLAPLKFPPEVVKEIRLALPTTVDWPQVIRECETIVYETQAKQKIKTDCRSGTENTKNLNKLKSSLTKAVDAFCDLNTSSQSQIYGCTAELLHLDNNRGKVVEEPSDIAMLFLAISMSTELAEQNVKKGKRREGDRCWFVRQVANVWQKHVREPSANNKKLQEFTRIMLVQIGYPIEETRDVLKQVLG